MHDRHLAGAVISLIAVLGAGGAHAQGTGLASARAYARAQRIALYRYHTRYIGNGEGLLAPIIRTADGGSLLVGTWRPPGRYRRGTSRPVVVRLDASGKKLWQKSYKKRGFVDYEGASALELSPGRYVVYILSYVNPAWGSVTRLLCLDDRGKVLWRRQLRGKGGQRTPFPQTLRRTKKGTLLMEGHIYLSRGETAHGWTGEVDLKTGKLLRDEVGQPNPYRRKR